MNYLAYQLARVIVWLRIVALASRWPFRPCIGDLVKHDGRVWTLTQGVRDPIWTLRGPGEPREVHRDDFTKIKTLRNLIGSFRSGYRFYDGYWREIWVSEQFNRLVRVNRVMEDPKCTLTDGSPVTPDHREIDPRTGLQKDYVVLSAEERAKGFVRPVRVAYRHQTCGVVTRMARSIAETYARAPGFYRGTYCAGCRKHFPVGADGEFTWDGTDEKVGT